MKNKVSIIFTMLLLFLFGCSIEGKQKVSNSPDVDLQNSRSSIPDPKFLSVTQSKYNNNDIYIEWCGTISDTTRYKITVQDKDGDEVTIYPSSMTNNATWNSNTTVFTLKVDKDNLLDLTGSFGSTVCPFKLYYMHNPDPIIKIHQSMGNIPYYGSGKVYLTYFDNYRNYVKLEWTGNISSNSASYFLLHDKYREVEPVMILNSKTVVFKKSDLYTNGKIATIGVFSNGNGGVNDHGRIDLSKPIPSEQIVNFTYNSSTIIQAGLPVTTPLNRRGYSYFVENANNAQVFPFYKFVSFKKTEFTKLFSPLISDKVVQMKVYCNDNLAITYKGSFILKSYNNNALETVNSFVDFAE